MKKYTSKEVRSIWLDFFNKKNHKIIESKSLIPINDPSLLWINSGVATLKDYFSGKKIPKNPRMVNSQKSIRTNDIENVGVTARHHTFFEMLGNFSIGDYFKKEAIAFAFELLFDVFEFKKNNIYITYFEKDKDTYNEWIKLGIKPSHLIKGNMEMNFWDVGQGPCGPDTEIFYDRGIKYDKENVGIKLLKEDLENDRYIEIWNIVFSQFNNDGENNHTELKQKNIDTGAGLERIVSIFQDAPTNFDTDLFLPIIRKIQELSTFTYKIDNYFNPTKEQTKINKNFRVIADHMRAVVMAIQDGAKPSNTQRGYIIRRLIRKAYRSGIELGIKGETFLYKLIDIIKKVLDVYPVDKNKVEEIIIKEEKSFSKTIKQGEEILEKELAKNQKELNVEIAFKLFETYGFPIELTQDIINEKGIKLNMSKFQKLKEEHSLKSKGKVNKAMDSQIQIIQNVESKISEFIGYKDLNNDSKIVFQGIEKDKVYVLLDKTPFYATKGGQHYDKGTLNNEEVLDVFKDKYENHWHILNNKIESPVKAIVLEDVRLNKERNHTSTHLLGLALIKVFDKSVIQLGSDNNEYRLTLDFPLDKKPTEQQLQQVEDLVNNLIKDSINREYHLMQYQNAIEKGVIGLENEDYGESDLRVVMFGESKEFCGGTHILNTSKIEQFKIIKLESKGSGVFRIKAITSNKTINAYNEKEISKLIEEVNILINKNKKIKSTYNYKIPKTINQLKQAIVDIKKDNKKISNELKNSSIDLDITFNQYNNKKTYINLDFKNPGQLKMTAIKLRDQYPEAIIILGSKTNDKQLIVVASLKEDAKDAFDQIVYKYKGNGGGNNNFAMGSCKLFNLKL